VTSGQLRVGDGDREAAVTALGDHYAAGRLTKDEFDERSESAWRARTASDLAALFGDLPRPVGAAAPAPPAPPVRTPHRRPGWLTPLLVVVVALVVLTHAPLFLLLGLVWVVLARGHRRGPWSSDRHAGRWTGR